MVIIMIFLFIMLVMFCTSFMTGAMLLHVGEGHGGTYHVTHDDDGDAADNGAAHVKTMAIKTMMKMMTVMTS